jgi:hypothetical protein
MVVGRSQSWFFPKGAEWAMRKQVLRFAQDDNLIRTDQRLGPATSDQRLTTID